MTALPLSIAVFLLLFLGSLYRLIPEESPWRPKIKNGLKTVVLTILGIWLFLFALGLLLFAFFRNRC